MMLTMNYRKVALALLFAVITMTASAVTLPFEVKAPKKGKIVEATTEGVNIRKAPSATAPRLVYNEAKIQYFDDPVIYYAYWSAAAPKGSIYAIPFEGLGIVASESNGWYEIMSAGPKKESNGWVSGKYVKEVTPTPLKYPATAATPDFAWVTDPNKPADGVYAVFTSEVNDMEGYVVFRVGRLIEDVVVCPYELFCPEFQFEEGRKTGLSGNTLYINSKDYSEEYRFDIRKFSKDVLLDIIKKATRADKTTTIYQIDGRLVEL